MNTRAWLRTPGKRMLPDEKAGDRRAKQQQQKRLRGQTLRQRGVGERQRGDDGHAARAAVEAVDHGHGVDHPQRAHHGERDRPLVEVERPEAEKVAELLHLDRGPGGHQQGGSELDQELGLVRDVAHVVGGSAGHEKEERDQQRNGVPGGQSRRHDGEEEAGEHADAPGERNPSHVRLAPAGQVGQADPVRHRRKGTLLTAPPRRARSMQKAMRFPGRGRR